jgi:hypothetical protein
MMGFGPERNDLAPLSDFIVTETVHIKRVRRQVNLFDWEGLKGKHYSWDFQKKTINVRCRKPHDIEIVLDDDSVADGWTIVWDVT